MLILKRLLYLQSVYIYKNFTQASESLNVSQPAISTAISALEEDLGVQLVVRSSKKVTFTYEGEQFMPWVDRILSLCQEAETAMHDLAHSADQRLHLGVSHALINPIIPMIYSTFLSDRPNAQIYLNEASMKKHVDMVRGELLDLAYNAFPTEREAEDLTIIPISTAEIHAVLHPDHPLAKLDRIPVRMLANEKMVMMDTQSKVNERMMQEFERFGISPDIVFHYEQILCMANLVNACKYVGIISAAFGHSAQGCEGLVLRPFEEPVVVDVGFILKKGRYLPKLGWEVINFIKEISQEWGRE